MKLLVSRSQKGGKLLVTRFEVALYHGAYDRFVPLFDLRDYGVEDFG